jgi:hypothetical protein
MSCIKLVKNGPEPRMLSKCFLFASISFLISCVEPYAPPVIADDFGLLVVDGFFVGNDSSLIKLSRTQNLESEVNSKPELHATVVVQSESGSEYPFIELGNGRYGLYNQNVDPSVRYRIWIRTDDTDEYESDFVPMQHGHLVDSVTYRDQVEDNSVEVSVYAHDPTNKTKYYYFTYDDTWQYRSFDKSVYRWENGQIIPRADATEIQNCYKTQYWRDYFLTNTTALSESVVHDLKLFTLAKSSRKLYFGYSVFVKLYGLTPESYSYYELIKLNSNELGSLFDPIPTQPVSNIRCITKPSEPVIGYFNASYLGTRRLFFRRIDLEPSDEVYEETGYELCEGRFAALDELSDKTFEGMIIGDRFFDPITFELLGYTYSTEQCMDCRKKGGVTNRPDYWYD